MPVREKAIREPASIRRFRPKTLSNFPTNLEKVMRLRTRIMVLLASTVFFAIVSVILSVIVGLVGAYFRHGNAEIGGNDRFVEWSFLVFALLSCAAPYEIWKMMAEDRAD
jgi:ABC-type glycerol-3-phosphate transport system permease component